jgi:purine-binding chemotaxis protein CheW
MSSQQITEKLPAGDQNQHLTFELSGEELAVPVANVREIIRYGKLTHMPMVPDFIEGVINLRGSVVPVINLAEKFGISKSNSDKRTCFIIMEIEMKDSSVTMGVVVDKVLQVAEIAESDIEPSPTLGANIQTRFITGMARTEDGFIVILDISRVLSADEIAVVSDMHEDAQTDETT